MRPPRYWVAPLVAALGLALLVAPGCGPGSGGRLPVQGAVTLDGEPVDEGVIVFLPAGGADAANRAGGPIKAGRYAIPARQGLLPGKYRVEIRWNQKTGRQISVPGDAPNMMDETRQVVPARYNTRSELTADVMSGSTAFDFALASK